MANKIEMATAFTKELDKALVQKSATGFLVDGALGAKFVGAKTVSIPDIDLVGLANYQRDNGFVSGAVTVARETYTLNMDRGRSFQIDAQDNDESGVANLAGQVAGEFVRTKVIPEMDAYALSKLAKLASDNNQTVTLAGGNLEAGCYNLFNEALMKAQEACGFDNTELVAFVNPTFWAALNASTAFTRQIIASDFKRGDVTTQVKSINGCALLPVSANRMKTAFLFHDGVTAEQTDGGFVPHGDAKNIGLIIMPKKAAMLVKKTEKVRVFSPDKNLGADAWKIDYRVYYDLFVKKSNKGAIFAYIEG